MVFCACKKIIPNHKSEQPTAPHPLRLTRRIKNKNYNNIENEPRSRTGSFGTLLTCVPVAQAGVVCAYGRRSVPSTADGFRKPAFGPSSYRARALAAPVITVLYCYTTTTITTIQLLPLARDRRRRRRRCDERFPFARVVLVLFSRL